jgi:hypothetical protein
MLYKYPRTFHLPWSDGVSNDDKIQYDLSSFIGKRVIITIKMDGENTTLYNNHLHARSLDTSDHESRHWLKHFHAQIKHMIPNGWRICGENLYAKHTIHYKDLDSYFMVFSIWDENNFCLSYTDTIDICKSINLVHVPVLYDGIINKDRDMYITESFLENQEGYVIRTHDGFSYDDFVNNVVKYVRKEHVKTNTHWMYDKLIKNNLKNKEY